MPKRGDRTEGPVAPPMAARTTPAQSRSRVTFERILSTAAELLGDVGIERLSTNLVCRRAGMTPPALYRYFPNKYAILSELARRLLEAQAVAVLAWVEAGGLGPSKTEDTVAKTERLQLLACARMHGKHERQLSGELRGTALDAVWPDNHRLALCYGADASKRVKQDDGGRSPSAPSA